MLNSFNFRDGLRNLFLDKGAIGNLPLESLRGKRIAVSSHTLIHVLGASPVIFAMKQNFARFKAAMDKYDIDVCVVFSGHDVFDLPRTQKFARLVRTFIEKTNLITLFSKLANYKEPASNEDWKLIHYVYVRLMDSIGWIYFFPRFYYEDMVAALDANGIRHVRAPQSTPNQLTYMLNSKSVDTIFCECFLYWFDDVDVLFMDFNLDEESVSFFDMPALQKIYGCGPRVLRKSLFASLGVFVATQNADDSLLLIQTLTTDFMRYFEVFNAHTKKMTTIIDDHVKIFAQEFDDSPIDPQFYQKLEQMADIKPEKFIDILKLYISCPIITEDDKTIAFSTMTEMGVSKYDIRSASEDLIYFYSNNFVDEQLFTFLNSTTGHCAHLFYSNVYSMGASFFSFSYFKKYAQNSLSKAFRAFGVPQSETFSIYTNSGKECSFSALELPLSRKYVNFASESPRNIIDYISAFLYPLSENFSVLAQGAPLSPQVLSNILTTNLLAALGYFKTDPEEILAPGFALSKVGGYELDEELLLIFEMARYGFMIPEQLELYAKDGDFIKNVLKDNIFEVVAKRWMQASSRSLMSMRCEKTDLRDEHDRSSFHNIYAQAAESKLELGDKNGFSSNDDAVKISTQQCLNQIYFNVKIFQALYLEYDTSNTALLFVDEIVKEAATDNVFGIATLAARFFCFIRPNYHLRDCHDIDLLQLRDCIHLIRKSLNMITQCDLVALLAESGALRDKQLVATVKETLPFRKDYSYDAGAVVKALLVQFIIYKELLRRKSPFCVIYKKRFSSEHVFGRFAIDFSVMDLLNKGRALLNKTTVMLKVVQSVVSVPTFGLTAKHLMEATRLVDEFIDFYATTD